MDKQLTAAQIWHTMTTNDRIELMDRYGRHLMPYYLQKPTEAQIIEVLSAAYKDKYLLPCFVEYRN